MLGDWLTLLSGGVDINHWLLMMFIDVIKGLLLVMIDKPGD